MKTNNPKFKKVFDFLIKEGFTVMAMAVSRKPLGLDKHFILYKGKVKITIEEVK